ncbi:MAG: prepilin-type N-terminal cleavage/methylation domain-containing protein [Clostridiales bacterium]|nr:prepilin-type N-terminal cleavage/methylation domain-containing protein [Clostridiales bacterium]
MKLNNKGFSLVEVLVAVAVSTIVFGAITALIVFASNSSRQTNARVALQNEAKDAVNHMEAYIIEAQSATWDSTANALVLIKDSEDAKEVETGNHTLSTVGPKVKVFNTAKKTFTYWYDKTAKKLFFGECRTTASDQTNTVDLTASLPTDDMYLLADNVEDFSCSIEKNKVSDKYTVNFHVQFKDNISEYSLDKCVYLRNQ